MFLKSGLVKCKHVQKPAVSFIKKRISKAINTDPWYEDSPWLLISATLYNKKILVSMLNCYCREHLIFLMLFVALTSRLVLNTLHSLLSSCPGASIEQWEIFFITQYFNFILVDNEVSHSVEITSWIRYLSFFTV